MTYHTYDFYKYVAPDVMGVSIPTVEDAAEDVIIDFCQTTSAYRQWLEDTVSVSTGDEEIEIDPPEDTAVVEIIAIQKIDSSGDYGDFVDQDTYQFSNREATPKIIFNDPVDEDYDARIRAALRPVVGFSDVPDWLWTDWRDVIASGIKYRLLSMRSQRWYSSREADLHLGAYFRGTNRAARQVVLETLNKINKPTSRYI
jgi:hypothetical protein